MRKRLRLYGSGSTRFVSLWLPLRNRRKVRRRALQRLAVDSLQRGGQLAAHRFDLLCPRRLALAAERRNRRAQAAAIVGIVDALHQLLALEPVDELRNVGAHAGALRGELAQADR